MWEEYISDQEDDDKIIDQLDYFINGSDSHIDRTGKYHWSMTKEEAYEVWRGSHND